MTRAATNESEAASRGKRLNSAKKRALIVGVTGQDGSYLAELLLRKRYEVHGLARSSSSLVASIAGSLHSFTPVDLDDPLPLHELLLEVRPDEIYYLAAHHFSSSAPTVGSREDVFLRVNVDGPVLTLQGMRRHLPESRLFFASSCQIFGDPDSSPQDEFTPHRPRTPYAISKSTSTHLCRYFREVHDLFVVAGILYNHESPRRRPGFVTTKIARAAALAYLGRPEPLVIRDLDAVVDWGAAEDYVRAMWLTLQQEESDDYVVASGIGRSVREFVVQAFEHVGHSPILLDGRTPTGVVSHPYVGNSARLRTACGWQPSITFEQLVKEMVDAQVRVLSAAGLDRS